MPRLSAPISAHLLTRPRRARALAVLLLVFALAVYEVGSLVGYVVAAGTSASLCGAAAFAHARGLTSSPLFEGATRALLSGLAHLAGWLLACVSRVLVAALLLSAVFGLGGDALRSLAKIAVVLAIAWLLFMLVAERVGRSSDDGWFS